MAWKQYDLYRIRGNQPLVDALPATLDERLRLGCPVTEIEHSTAGVRITYRDGGQAKIEQAEHFATAMPLATLRQIPVKPEWPDAKRYVIENIPHSSHCRVIFQTRSRFWQANKIIANMNPGDPSLGSVWAMADEVETRRGILIGTALVTTPEKASEEYRGRYPGKSERYRRIDGGELDQRSAGDCLPAIRAAAWSDGEVLAGGDPTDGPHSFRRRIRGQLSVRHGGCGAVAAAPGA
jgi:hypothetical protein